MCQLLIASKSGALAAYLKRHHFPGRIYPSDSELVKAISIFAQSLVEKQTTTEHNLMIFVLVCFRGKDNSFSIVFKTDFLIILFQFRK
jgi:hypothetical protein